MQQLATYNPCAGCSHVTTVLGQCLIFESMLSVASSSIKALLVIRQNICAGICGPALPVTWASMLLSKANSCYKLLFFKASPVEGIPCCSCSCLQAN